MTEPLGGWRRRLAAIAATLMLGASPVVVAAVPANAEPALKAAYDHGKDKGRAPGTRGPLPKGFSATELTVKFRSDDQVRVRRGKAAARASGNAAALQKVLDRYSARIRPLSSRSEQSISDRRVQGEKRTGRRLPDLNSWFTVTVPRNIEGLLKDLNALPFVEIAQAGPEIAPTADPLQPQQKYRNAVGAAAGTGVDADAAHTVPGGKGDRVTVTDLEGDMTITPRRNSVSVAAGDEHTLVVDNYTSGVWAGGGGARGQLGIGSTQNSTTMVAIPGLSNVSAVAAGDDFSLALSSGAIWAWGANDQGQLGDGTTTDRSTPVKVNGITNAVSIAAGARHGMAVLSDGTVRAWGDNVHGQLGDGTTNDRSTPISVSALTGVSTIERGAIDGGAGHSLALLASGEVKSWGLNANGQLGNTATTDSLTPITVPGLAGKQVAAGAHHSLVVSSNNTISAFGKNDFGQLGDGTTVQRTTPVQVSTVTGAVIVSGGSDYSLATSTTDGLALWGWGSNAEGQLGNGTTASTTTPVRYQDPEAASVMRAVSAGTHHTILTTNDYGIWSFGDNAAGQLGLGTTTDTNVPTEPLRLNLWNFCHEDLAHTTPEFLKPSIDGPCSTRSHGTGVAGIIGAKDGNGKGIAGIAPNVRFRLGDSLSYADALADTEPGDVLLFEYAFVVNNRQHPVELSAVYYDLTVLATAAGVTVVEPGGNNTVNLDDPANPNAVTIMSRPDSGAIMVGAGEPPSDNGVNCVDANRPAERTAWKYSTYGSRVDVQGYGLCIATLGVSSWKNLTPSETDPNKMYRGEFGGTSGAGAIVAGVVASLQGVAKHMGAPLSPQLVRHILKVTGTPQPPSDPKHVGPLPNLRRAIDFLRGGIAVGGSWTMAVGNDGKVRSWGSNSHGQLGDGTTTGRNVAAEVAGLSGVVRSPRALAAGSAHALAVKADGTVWAWGENSAGQLGDGTTTNRSLPVQVSGLSGMTAVAADDFWSLALKSDGTLWAWGDGLAGQLGNGDQENRMTPVQVSGLTDVVDMAAGRHHGLAVKSDGTLWAWGDNTYGQLGDGSTDTRLTPVQVTAIGDLSTWAGSVAAGDGHSLTVGSNGAVAAWGRNDLGQLGTGSTGPDVIAPHVVSGLTGVFGVGAGASHSFAMRFNRTTFAWGANDHGMLGLGSTGETMPKPSLIGTLTGATSSVGSGIHSAAMLHNGTAYTWGYGGHGQLGHGDNNSLHIPAPVSGTP
ncbi:S8 family serine peptidase [Thermomonospora umbrina]|uniref:Alpha-tubulin suppressor-like RCC1 family protein n=1 Tax=Thermomonospora umbrina TaxID=111806 RepID=A0A3D9SV93_9ACTN|nr:S8 family serine peptidase [Thermomonospora umbrina]REE98420.1 alpha-tubulin suppressor-like RCC1 family protein [Thermomonospora umbrina]